MTCASHVQAQGQGFPGQLGCWSDAHLPGLTRLAAGIKAAGSVAYVQLHHAGMRSPQDLIGTQPVCPSDDAETGLARADAGGGRTAARGLHRRRSARRARRLRRRRAPRRARLHPEPVPEQHVQPARGSLRRFAGEPLPPRVRNHRRHPCALPPGLHARHPRFAGALRAAARARCARSCRACCTTAGSISSTCRCGTCSRNRTRTGSSRSRWSTGSWTWTGAT